MIFFFFEFDGSIFYQLDDFFLRKKSVNTNHEANESLEVEPFKFPEKSTQ